MKLDQSLDANQRLSYRELLAVAVEHPRRKLADRVVRQLTQDPFAVTMSLSGSHLQRLPIQRMPGVVDRDGLKMMCIM